MPQIKIEWLSDVSECDQGGCSGGYAEGFVATLDGKPLAEFIPSVSCCDSDTCDSDEAYKMIFKALGFDLEVEY